MERVSVKFAPSPLLLIAPHGADDEYTAELTLYLADKLNCSCVVNNGWKRSNRVDVDENLANCNNIEHCLAPIVKDEFYSQITKAISINGFFKMFSVIVHGMRDITYNNTKLGGIIGVGNNHKTCLENNYKTLSFLLNSQNSNLPGLFLIAGNNTPYSGGLNRNLNKNIPRIESLQLELIKHIRENNKKELVGVFEKFIDNLHKPLSQEVNSLVSALPIYQTN